MSKELNLHEPQRQNPFGVAVIFYKNLRIAINIILPFAVVNLGGKMSFWQISIYGISSIVLLLFLILSYFQYRRFFFYVEDDRFVLEEGVFKRDKITVAFDRIQSVNLNQNIIQQILGVTGLKVDTAGSKSKEMEIPALNKAYARALQAELLKRKEETIGEAEDAEAITEDGIATKPKERRTAIEHGEPLLKLSFKDVLRVGITENHLRSGLILFAVINGYIWQFEDYILKPFEDYIDNTTNTILAYGLIIVPISIMLFFIIGMLFSTIQSALKYFNLRFYANEKGVQLKSGLLKKAEYQIPFNKIQYIKWATNPLRNLIGYKTITVKQAGSEEATDKNSLQIPGAKQQQLETVLDFFFPQREGLEDNTAVSHWLLASQLTFWTSLVPVTGLIIGGFFLSWLWYPIPLVILFVFFFSYKYYKSIQLKWNAELLVLERGYVFPKRYILKFYKLQNVALSESFLQRPRGLAHLHLHTAAGDLRMPHLDKVTAEKLYNYILYKIESSEKNWM
jgi:putative membrane protein